MSASGLRWASRPSRIGTELAGRLAGVDAGLRTLARTHAARGQALMQQGAPWNDQSGFARAALYGQAEGTTIYLGTSNDQYGLFLELGTVKMAAYPIIQPTLPVVAQAYFQDAAALVGSMLGG